VSDKDGLIAAAAVLIGAALLGESYPFSRFSMYAKVGARSSAAVPVFLADDRLVQPERFTGFRGLDPSWSSRLKSMPGSLGYVTDDAQRWIMEHSSAESAPPGPVRFAIGYVVVTLAPGGKLTREAHLLSEGRAWPR
jgi:hypothetical protein